MAGFKRIGWLVAVALTLSLAIATTRADDDGDTSGGGGSPEYSAYWQAYQQWLIFQQRIYEDRRHDAAVQAEQMKKDRLDRQLYHPPLTEIWAAEPLNALLSNLQDAQARGGDLPNVAIADAVLQHTNLTPAPGAGNLAMLKDNGLIAWPMALRRDSLRPLEERLEELTVSLVKQARGESVQPNDYRHALVLLDQAQAEWKSQVAVVSASDYIQGKRFLTDLSAAVKALSELDAGRALRNQYSAKGRSVAELVAYMGANGLKFAPATAGDRPAYLALHQALASCALSATAQAVVQ